jgi:hypothetical protein
LTKISSTFRPHTRATPPKLHHESLTKKFKTVLSTFGFVVVVLVHVSSFVYSILEVRASIQNVCNVLFLYSWKGGNGFSTRMVPKLQITSGEATSDL